jgi:hypothetical protein
MVLSAQNRHIAGGIGRTNDQGRPDYSGGLKSELQHLYYRGSSGDSSGDSLLNSRDQQK